MPEAAVPAGAGSGLSQSAVLRRFKALSEAKFMQWMSSDLLGLDLLVIQVDGLHMGDNLLMIGAIGVDSSEKKHPLGVVEGATENAAVVQALLDNLIERVLDPEICRLVVVDGAKALSKAIRCTFGADTPIQRCQIHKGRNIVERLPGISTQVFAEPCARPGNSRMPPRQSVFYATLPGGLSRRRRASPAPSSKDWTRSSRW